MKKIIVTFCTSFLLLIIHAQQQSQNISNYIRKYRAIAVEEMQRTGVPAAIKLAQGIHESMAGQSELTSKSNNHFGIKCKKDYTGPYVLHNDDAPNERFMKYENAEQSFKDHSDFLKNKERYAFLFRLDPTDYKGWAYGLKKAGYATNPRYPQLIISIIERYDLNDYTLIAMGKKEMPEDMKEYYVKKEATEILPAVPQRNYPEGDFKINATRVVFIKKGTPYAIIARQYDIPLERLYDFNDMPSVSTATLKDELVYLQLKRTEGEKDYHEVASQESVHDIAQMEGVRLTSLLQYNNLTREAVPQKGSKVLLKDPNKIRSIAFH